MNVRYRVELSQAERDELTAMLLRRQARRPQAQAGGTFLPAAIGAAATRIFARTVSVSLSTVGDEAPLRGRQSGAGLERGAASGRGAQAEPRQSALRARTRLLAQGPLQIAFHEAAFGPADRGEADPDGPGNLRVAAAPIGRQQNLSPFEFAGGVLAATEIAVSSSRSAWLNSTR